MPIPPRTPATAAAPQHDKENIDPGTNKRTPPNHAGLSARSPLLDITPPSGRGARAPRKGLSARADFVLVSASTTQVDVEVVAAERAARKARKARKAKKKTRTAQLSMGLASLR